MAHFDYIRCNPLWLALPALLSTLLVASSLQADERELGGRVFSTFPSDPSTDGAVFLRTTVGPCRILVAKGIEIDPTARQISVAVGLSYFESSPCIPAGLRAIRIPLHALTQSDTYTLSVFDWDLLKSADYFDPSTYIGDLEVFITAVGPRYNVETPTQNSTQSGIGIVRGWACDADSVEVSFNGGQRIAIAYGTSRRDTVDTCGDENNGYGAVLNWGNLGPGTHNMTTYIDDIELSTIEFEVAGLNDPFLRDASAKYELDNFPEPGQSVTIAWSEPDQNFIIVDSAPPQDPE